MAGARSYALAKLADQRGNSMAVASAFSDVPVVGGQPPARIAAKLRELGDIETAEMIEASERRGVDSSLSFGVPGGMFRPKPWQHTAHVYGYLAVSPPGAQMLPIQHAGNIAADTTLKNG